MRNALLLLCALAIFTTGLTSSAHADMANMECAPHVSDTVNLDQNNVDDTSHDQANFDDCQNCCCMHAHIYVGTLQTVLNNTILKRKDVFIVHTSLRSKTLSPLYRPPMA